MSQLIAEELARVPMSPTLMATLTRAADYARQQGHGRVTLEHVLLALTEDSDAALVLQASQVAAEPLNADVTTHLSSLQPDGGDGPISISPELKRVLEAAAAAAQQGRRQVTGAIVLAAIVGEGKSTAAQMLRAQGLTFEHAIKALQRSARQQAAKAPPATQAPARASPPRQPAPGAEASPAASQPATASPPPVAEPPRPAAPAAPPPPAAMVPAQPPQAPAAPRTAPPPLFPPAAPEPPAQASGQQAPLAETAAPPVEPAPRHSPSPSPSPSPAPPPPRAPIAPPEAPPLRPMTQVPQAQPPAAAQAQAQAPAPLPYAAPGSEPSWQPAALPREEPATAPPRPDFAPEPAPPAPYARASEPAYAPASPAYYAPAAPEQPYTPAQPYAPVARDDEPPWQPQMPPYAPSPTHQPPSYQDYPPVSAYPAARPEYDLAARSQLPALVQHHGEEPPAAASGQLIENIPRTMRVDSAVTVEVRLVGTNDAGSDGRFADAVRAMSVRLSASDGGYVVESLTPETQWIEGGPMPEGQAVARWRWMVVPQEAGRRNLQLAVSTRWISSNGISGDIPMPAQQVTVSVRRRWGRSFARLGGWVVAAGLGAAAALFGGGAWKLMIALAKPLMGG